MACPFFEPTDAIETGPWLHRPRLPLGDTYTGWCHSSEPRQIEDIERDICNHGYARGQCERFPSECQADAVRFSIKQENPLELIYILEKDHAPMEHGVIGSAAEASNPMLAAQAQAFLASYARLIRSAATKPAD